MPDIQLTLPWAPASENLTQADYEAMESCIYKYEHYGRAVRLFFALREADTKHVLVMGAGMGGLIRACRDVGGVPLRCITAIERNAAAVGAIRKLFSQLAQLVHGEATALATWMQLSAHCPPDIVVLEMMGSIGCNEAQPEICATARKVRTSFTTTSPTPSMFLP